MNKLSDLTREFHDQFLKDIKMIDNSLEMIIKVIEVGNEYSFDGKKESYWAYPDDFKYIDEYERVIKLIFYDVDNLEKNIEFNDIEKLNLDINLLKIDGSNVCIFCENNINLWIEIKFDSKGFDLIYLKDKERKL